MQRIPRHLLIEELSKQYEVEAVNMNAPISPDMYSALVAVQPSSLAPPAFDRLLEAIEAGVPVAIFEDPAPVGTQHITPTGSPKQSPGGMFGGGGGPQPKGDIRQLMGFAGARRSRIARDARHVHARSGLATAQSLSDVGRQRERAVGVYR